MYLLIKSLPCRLKHVRYLLSTFVLTLARGRKKPRPLYT